MSDFNKKVEVRKIQTLTEYKACQEIHRQVWGFEPDDSVIHLPLMVALQENGGLILGAFSFDSGAQNQTASPEKMVGFAAGFIGRDPVSGEYFHYSQVVATLREWQNKGVGFSLKTSQRLEVLKQGFKRMCWAFDPLEARNAFFNIGKLGGKSKKYVVNMYGSGRGKLFGQLDTDRLVVDWELDTSRVKHRLELCEKRQKYHYPDFERESLPDLIEIEWGAQNIPVLKQIRLNRNEPLLKLEIPYNFKQLRESDPDLASNWRNQTRLLFTHYFDQKYSIVDFVTYTRTESVGAFYILQKDGTNY